ncbi:MAG: glyoxalase [Kaistia sp. SCN 65-12]|nr:MAG: glyoxalase [Kaistia sp. SCN 65-12]
MAGNATSFFWYELMTSDMDAAEAFYTDVVGWTAEPFETPADLPRYTVVMAGGRGVGGLMPLPEEAAAAGMPPAWIGYIHTEDIDASTESLRKAGGAVHREPSEIPGVGRFAVVADPQGAMFMFLQPEGSDQQAMPMTTPGHVGWAELYASDRESAVDFYAGQFGWTRHHAMDMGEMGIYQIFAVDGEPTGGIMTRPPQVPAPAWQFYFNVDAIDAAAARVATGGGKVTSGPVEVPGGSWIVQCQDPQGAHFALVAPKR